MTQNASVGTNVDHIMLKFFGFYNSGHRSTVTNAPAVVALS